jgi:hypothetical protein
VTNRQDLVNAVTCPCYVKLAHSTAGCGVWRVENAAERDRLADMLMSSGQMDGRAEMLVQQPAPGTLCVAQSVFQHGRLLGLHCYQARAQGVGGSAWARVSVSHPVVGEHLAKLGAHLNWHGALMFDYLYDPAEGTPRYIDGNPRIGETFNATRSGVNLCELLVQVSLDRQLEPLPAGQEGVLTHNLVMRLMALAQEEGRRWPLFRELGRRVRRRGLYSGSQDEQTRWSDVVSLVPAAFLTAQLAINPRSARRIVAGAVDNYALSAEAARTIRELDPEQSLKS